MEARAAGVVELQGAWVVVHFWQSLPRPFSRLEPLPEPREHLRVQGAVHLLPPDVEEEPRADRPISIELFGQRLEDPAPLVNGEAGYQHGLPRFGEELPDHHARITGRNARSLGAG